MGLLVGGFIVVGSAVGVVLVASVDFSVTKLLSPDTVWNVDNLIATSVTASLLGLSFVVLSNSNVVLSSSGILLSIESSDFVSISSLSAIVVFSVDLSFSGSLVYSIGFLVVTCLSSVCGCTKLALSMVLSSILFICGMMFLSWTWQQEPK